MPGNLTLVKVMADNILHNQFYFNTRQFLPFKLLRLIFPCFYLHENIVVLFLRSHTFFRDGPGFGVDTAVAGGHTHTLVGVEK